MPNPLVKYECCDNFEFVRVIGPDRRALVECNGARAHLMIKWIVRADDGSVMSVIR